MSRLIRTARRILGPAAAATWLATGVGCARPYYYQPAYAPAPMQTLQPGAPYVPGQAVPGQFAPGQLPAVQPYTVPGNSNFAPSGGGLQPIPSTQPPPSTFDGNGGTSGSNSGSPYYEDNGQPYNQSVPDADYGDPGGYGNPSDDFLTPDSGDLNSASNPADKVGTLQPQVGPLDLAAAPQSAPNHVSQFDAAVIPADAVDMTPAVAQTGFEDIAAVVPTHPEPYAFDSDGYTWLRGIVSYDATEQVWSITYDTTPDSWDHYAGHLTLLGDVPAEIADNDIVLVEGAVDTAQQDRLGKPVYRISSIAPLERL